MQGIHKKRLTTSIARDTIGITRDIPDFIQECIDNRERKAMEKKMVNCEVKDLEKEEYVVKAYQQKLGEAVGKQYARARKDKGLTQQQVADISGIKRPNIARLEGGKHSPTVDMLARVANSMGMMLEIRLVDKQE